VTGFGGDSLGFGGVSLGLTRDSRASSGNLPEFSTPIYEVCTITCGFPEFCGATHWFRGDSMSFVAIPTGFVAFPRVLLAIATGLSAIHEVLPAIATVLSAFHGVLSAF